MLTLAPRVPLSSDPSPPHHTPREVRLTRRSAVAAVAAGEGAAGVGAVVGTTSGNSALRGPRRDSPASVPVAEVRASFQQRVRGAPLVAPRPGGSVGGAVGGGGDFGLFPPRACAAALVRRVARRSPRSLLLAPRVNEQTALEQVRRGGELDDVVADAAARPRPGFGNVARADKRVGLVAAARSARAGGGVRALRGAFGRQGVFKRVQAFLSWSCAIGSRSAFRRSSRERSARRVASETKKQPPAAFWAFSTFVRYTSRSFRQFSVTEKAFARKKNRERKTARFGTSVRAGVLDASTALRDTATPCGFSLRGRSSRVGKGERGAAASPAGVGETQTRTSMSSMRARRMRSSSVAAPLLSAPGSSALQGSSRGPPTPGPTDPGVASESIAIAAHSGSIGSQSSPRLCSNRFASDPSVPSRAPGPSSARAPAARRRRARLARPRASANVVVARDARSFSGREGVVVRERVRVERARGLVARARGGEPAPVLRRLAPAPHDDALNRRAVRLQAVHVSVQLAGHRLLDVRLALALHLLRVSRGEYARRAEHVVELDVVPERGLRGGRLRRLRAPRGVAARAAHHSGRARGRQRDAMRALRLQGF